MSRKRSLEKYKELLSKFNNLYREGNPKISDVEFDSILENLKKDYPDDYLEVRSNLLEQEGDFKHKYVAGSLEKIKSDDLSALKDWIDKTYEKAGDYIITPKLDGLSIVLYYNYGKLVYAVTRGDGYTGLVQTEKFRNIVPNEINLKYPVAIRGECIFSKKGFETYTSLENKEFKNPRNAAVGLINSKEADPEKIKCLSFCAYSLKSSSLIDYIDQLNLLKLNGFLIPPFKVLKHDCITNDILEEWYDEWSDKDTLFEFEIDGLVIQSNKINNENLLIPEYARAYKLNRLQLPTVIKDIEWNISKSGYFVPTGIIEPISLGGSEISRVTLFNYSYVIKQNIGIGSEVLIQKSGDIIPYVKSVLSTSAINKAPSVCPYCGEKLETCGVELRCPNSNCIPQKLKQLSFLLKNTKVEIAAEQSLLNWGITDIDKLINFIPDTKFKNQIKFNKELAEKFYTSSPKKLISCMDFDGVSIKTFKKLFRQYFTGDVEDFINTFTVVSPTIWNIKANDIVKKISGIGLITLNQIRSIFINRNKKILDTIINSDNYKKYYNKDNTIETPKNTILENLSFCFTGTLSEPRRMYEDIVQLNGGTVLLNVSKKLDYLVCDNVSKNSNKLIKAREFGIKIITEEQFFDLCKEHKK